jgi:hypothetical protein
VEYFRTRTLSVRDRQGQDGKNSQRKNSYQKPFEIFHFVSRFRWASLPTKQV